MGFSPSEKHVTSTSIHSNIVDSATGSFTESLTISGVPVPLEAGSSSEYINIRDEKSSGVAGGTFSSGDWRTRILNTIADDDTGDVTLVTNQFTLPAGTYQIMASAPAYFVAYHQLRLRNTSDSSTPVIGSSTWVHNNGNYSQVNHSFLSGQFTITSSKTFELQHRCSLTMNTAGMGQPSSFVTEVYAQVALYKSA